MSLDVPVGFIGLPFTLMTTARPSGFQATLTSANRGRSFIAAGMNSCDPAGIDSSRPMVFGDGSAQRGIDS